MMLVAFIITNTKYCTYLEDNMVAISIELNSAQMKALDDAMVPGKIVDKGYSALEMAAIDQKV